jgi:hypothetical protein
LISAGTFNHLVTNLSLKFLRLTANLIKFVEDRLEFFRRQTGHTEFNANTDNSAGHT